LTRAATTYELAQTALTDQRPLREVIESQVGSESIPYDPVYTGASHWRLCLPIDHPEPSRCLVSGTGLTHLGSAANRQAMHGRADAELTDSMRMFRLGLEQGRPAAGAAGAAPEWFF